MSKFKRKSIENILIRGSIAKLVQLAILFGRNILIIPILLNTWGVEKYGLWIAVISFFELLMSIEAGHAHYISNEFNRLYFSDKEAARKILGSSVKVTYLSNILQFLILYFLLHWGFLDFIFSTNLEGLEDSESISKGIFALIIFRFLIGSVRGIITKIIFPLGYMDRTTYIKTLERIAEIIILIYAGWYSLSIMDTCILFAIYRFFYSIVVLFLIKKWMPEFFPWWKGGNIKIGLRNYFISISLTFNFFVDRFSKDGLNLLISSTLGLAVLPVFTTLKTLINFATQGTNLIMGPLQPELVRFHASRQWEKIIESIKMNWLISNIILNIPFLVMIFIIGDLYEIWTNGKLAFNEELFILLAISVLLFNYGNSYMTYLKGINHIRGLLTITILRSLLIIVLSLVFLKSLGIIGVGVAMLITELLTSVRIPYIFVKNKLAEEGFIILSRDRMLATFAILIVAVVYFLKLQSWLPNVLLIVISLFFLLMITTRQWKFLHNEIKEKIFKLMPLKVRQRLRGFNRTH